MNDISSISLTKAELLDLISAICEASNELCCGVGFNEANAYSDRLGLLKTRLEREYLELSINTEA